MQELIFKLDEKDKDALGTVRCIPGLQAAAAEAERSIWLRGIAASETTDIRLKQLPVKKTFAIDEQSHLFLPGGLTPVDKLQELAWQPLQDFIKAEPPVAALPGNTNEQVSIQLVVSAKERKGAALMTTLAVWKGYAETASGIRLQAVEFAVSVTAAVFILGYPLPSLPGKEYWMEHDILLPCGYEFEIPMASIFISRQLNESRNAIIVFDEQGNWQKIDKAFFVPGKRSAVRLTTVQHD